MVHYACGLIRDSIGRFVVTTSIDDDIITPGQSTLSVETWVANDVTPLRAITDELFHTLGISQMNKLNVANKKVYERMGRLSHQKITVFLFEAVSAITLSPGPTFDVRLFTKGQLRGAVLTKEIGLSVYGASVLNHIDALTQ